MTDQNYLGNRRDWSHVLLEQAVLIRITSRVDRVAKNSLDSW